MNSTCVDSSLLSALIPRPHLNPQTTLEETVPELIALPIVSHLYIFVYSRPPVFKFPAWQL